MEEAGRETLLEDTALLRIEPADVLVSWVVATRRFRHREG